MGNAPELRPGERAAPWAIGEGATAVRFACAVDVSA